MIVVCFTFCTVFSYAKSSLKAVFLVLALFSWIPARLQGMKHRCSARGDKLYCAKESGCSKLPFLRTKAELYCIFFNCSCLGENEGTTRKNPPKNSPSYSVRQESTEHSKNKTPCNSVTHILTLAPALTFLVNSFSLVWHAVMFTGTIYLLYNDTV